MRVLLIGHPTPETGPLLEQLTGRLPEAAFDTISGITGLNAALAQVSYDLILVEDCLTDGSVIDVLHTVTAMPAGCPVMLLCHAGSEALVSEALQEGLDGYEIDPLEHMGGLEFGLRVALRRYQNRQAELNELRYRRFFLRAPVGLYRTSVDNRVLAANPALLRMLGFDSLEELTATSLKDLYVDIRDRDAWRERMEVENTLQGVVLQLRRKDGTQIAIRDTGQAIRDGNGNVLYYEGSLEDISEQRRAEEQLIYLSLHDALTGLFNRSYFEQELKRLETYPDTITVIMSDVDNLKGINDRLGHFTGDEALRATARILTSAFRVEDMIARIGGDEFVVILPGAGDDQIQPALDRIHQRMATFAEQPHNYNLRISFGAATARSGADLLSALQLADSRMYLDKQSPEHPDRHTASQTGEGS
jgi:diguanylate cyclase (GGDEF)-like protein/PAS domain S-box-containing protein